MGGDGCCASNGAFSTGVPVDWAFLNGRPFFAISILNPNYDIINDVISGFAKVVVARCGFNHWIAQRISWGEVVSVFLYLL